jgi:hypothetical protein
MCPVETEPGLERIMNNKNAILSAALTGLMLGAAIQAAPNQEKEQAGECHGVNSCKGTSACAGKANGCAGMNSCKGKGWLKMSEKECLEKKGTFKPMSMDM